jgi:hypothetical protein
MSAKHPSRPAVEIALQLTIDRSCGIDACELFVQLLAQRPPRTEQQRLQRGYRHSEAGGYFGIRAAFELTHHERDALRSADALESSLTSTASSSS